MIRKLLIGGFAACFLAANLPAAMLSGAGPAATAPHEGRACCGAMACCAKGDGTCTAPNAAATAAVCRAGVAPSGPADGAFLLCASGCGREDARTAPSVFDPSTLEPAAALNRPPTAEAPIPSEPPQPGRLGRPPLDPPPRA